MNKKTNTIVLVCIIVLMIIILIVSAGFRYAGAKVLPMIVAGCVLLLSILEIVRSNRVEEAADSAPEDRERKEGYLRKCLLIGGWLVGFLVAITITGFHIAMLLFIVSYLKWQGRRWFPTIVMAMAVTFIIYGLFSYLLGVELYRGLIMSNV